MRHVSDAIQAVHTDYTVVLADEPALVSEAYRLRHQVYCLERKFEVSRGGLEYDEYDTCAKHVLLGRRSTGQFIGTARLVLSYTGGAGVGLPLQRVCYPGLLGSLPANTTGEVSRFAISKEWFGANRSAGGSARLALIRGLLEISEGARVTHWCAAMERSLLRLLQRTAIHFEPLGPPVDYHGLRQPAFVDINCMLSRVRKEKPAVWNYLTRGGVSPYSNCQAMAA